MSCEAASLPAHRPQPSDSAGLISGCFEYCVSCGAGGTEEAASQEGYFSGCSAEVPRWSACGVVGFLGGPNHAHNKVRFTRPRQTNSRASRLYLRDQRANGVWGKGLEVGVWVSSTAMNGDIAQARSKQAKVARLFLVAEGR